jgi:ubiquinone/menaquinone biosynthesis C-methylase UbiE
VTPYGRGPGTITVGLAGRVPDGHVTGIDNAPEVLEEARELARGRANLEFATGDVYALDYPDDTFCVVHAHQVLQHLSDPVKALQEMWRVTRPGGLIAVRDGDYGSMVWYPDIPALDKWRVLYERIARGKGGEPNTAFASYLDAFGTLRGEQG